MSEISIFNITFWDLFLQKIFRNFASVKYQWLTFLYVPTILGMFVVKAPGITDAYLISPKLGLAFLGGGFVTLATSRLVARTSLKENNKELDTES